MEIFFKFVHVRTPLNIWWLLKHVRLASGQVVRLLLGCFLVKLNFENVFANSAKSKIRTLILFFAILIGLLMFLNKLTVMSATVKLCSNIFNLDFPQTANMSYYKYKQGILCFQFFSHFKFVTACYRVT